jgi:hypothetical protein
VRSPRVLATFVDTNAGDFKRYMIRVILQA